MNRVDNVLKCMYLNMYGYEKLFYFEGLFGVRWRWKSCIVIFIMVNDIMKLIYFIM